MGIEEKRNLLEFVSSFCFAILFILEMNLKIDKILMKMKRKTIWLCLLTLFFLYNANCIFFSFKSRRDNIIAIGFETSFLT